MSDPAAPNATRRGGRPRLYDNATERGRAWRERQRAQRAETSQDPPTITPGLAETSLSISLQRLQELITSHQQAITSEVTRVAAAIAALSDPEAVAEELATSRAETARQIAQAEEAAAKANHARAAAETAARRATAERVEAETAANAAWDRVETLEALNTQLQADLDTLRAQHAAALQAARAEAQTAIDTARTNQARAEGIASELRNELDTTRTSHAETIRRLQTEHATNLETIRRQTTEHLTAEHAHTQTQTTRTPKNTRQHQNQPTTPTRTTRRKQPPPN